MTPKSRKYVDQERQGNFSCKHENTLSLWWKCFWSLTVASDGLTVSVCDLGIRPVFNGHIGVNVSYLMQ